MKARRLTGGGSHCLQHLSGTTEAMVSVVPSWNVYKENQALKFKSQEAKETAAMGDLQNIIKRVRPRMDLESKDHNEVMGLN